MKECCENCRYSKLLKIYKRKTNTIGGNGIVSGVKVAKKLSAYEDSMCCTYFINEENAPVIETFGEDYCECWRGIAHESRQSN